jgi:aminobenzoyl-glutamate transport protein
VHVDGTDAATLATPVGALTPEQRSGLRRAAFAAGAVVALFALLALAPGYHPLIDDAAEGAARLAPFYNGLIAGFFLLFLACGWAYGAAAGTIRSHRDVVRMMGEGMRDLAPYIVIVFFAAHFVAVFAWSGLGPVMAIKGAEQLRTLALPVPLLLVSLLLMSSVFDLLIGSASAKWSVMAPIVVPLLMLLGVSPEMTTAAYRMGDSIFNIVTPVASNFVLVLVMCQRWVKGFGVGSLIALMLPFSIAIGATGLALVTAWVTLGLPVGPGAPAAYALSAPR